MLTMIEVLLLIVLIVWLLDREDDLPHRSRVLQFRPRAPRAPRGRGVVSGRPIRSVRADGTHLRLLRPLPGQRR